MTRYEPINLCVSAGDYVDFNDEGGYVENVYRSGVPYQVIGAVRGSTMDSFLKNNGTGNGATLSPTETGSAGGFASNQNEELMMQVTLGTGANATHICAGGTAGLPPVLAPIRVSPQTDGVNHAGIVSVAVFLQGQPMQRCGDAEHGRGRTSYGHTNFSLPARKTEHVRFA